MEKIIYADHSATTYVKKEVLEEMLPYFTIKYGNPSSIHSLGCCAKDAIEVARERVAKAIHAQKEEIYFTSGGTESDNIAIRGIAYANYHKGNHIITSKIEHKAVLNTLKKLEKEGFEVTYLDVDKDGMIKMSDLIKAIKRNTILITIMYANNEIGTIEPIEEIATIAKNSEIIFHTDAVQAISSIDIDVKKIGIDALSLSSHKIYGPKGIGALYVRKEVSFHPICYGGSQENGKRPGTENVPAIVGLGKAIELVKKNIVEMESKLVNLREYMIERLLNEIPNSSVNGHRIKRLSNNINVTIDGVPASDILIYLNMNGICVSAASACNSTNVEPSHVLKAIGLNSEKCKSSIRISLGEQNTKQDIDVMVDSIKNYMQL